MDKYSGRPRLKVFNPKRLEKFFEVEAKSPYVKFHIQGAKKGKEYDFYFFKVGEVESKGLVTRNEGVFTIDALGGAFKIIEVMPPELKRFLVEANKVVPFVEAGGWRGERVLLEQTPIALAVLAWRDGHAEELVDIQLEFKINTDRILRVLMSKYFNEGGLPITPPVVDVPPVVIPVEVEVPEEIASIPAVDVKASVYQSVLSRGEMINPSRFVGGSLPSKKMQVRTSRLQTRGVATAVSDKFNSLMTQAVDQFPALFEQKSSENEVSLRLQEAFLRIKKGLKDYITSQPDKRKIRGLLSAINGSAIPIENLHHEELSAEEIDRLAGVVDEKMIGSLIELAEVFGLSAFIKTIKGSPNLLDIKNTYRDLVIKTIVEKTDLINLIQYTGFVGGDLKTSLPKFIESFPLESHAVTIIEGSVKIDGVSPFYYLYHNEPSFKLALDKYTEFVYAEADRYRVQGDVRRALDWTTHSRVETPKGQLSSLFLKDELRLLSRLTQNASEVGYYLKGIMSLKQETTQLVKSLTENTSSLSAEVSNTLDVLAAIPANDTSSPTLDSLFKAFDAKGVTLVLYSSKRDYKGHYGTANPVSRASVYGGVSSGGSRTFLAKLGNNPKVIGHLRAMLWALGVCQQYSRFNLDTIHLCFEDYRAHAINLPERRSCLIRLSLDEPPQTAVHEMMHSLEYYSKSVQDYVTMFFLQHLKDPPKTSAVYKGEQNFVLEKAPAQYAGKFYSHSSATELVTMTVQEFATPLSLKKYAEAYPKFFLFGYNIVKGLVHIPESER